MNYNFKYNNLQPQMDELSEDDIISIMSKMNMKVLLQFIRTSQFHKNLFKYGFIDKCKYLSDDELAWIRSHGDELVKTIARQELLNRYPQLVLLTDETIRVAIKLYKENSKECIQQYGKYIQQYGKCIQQYGPIELWDVSEVTDMSTLFQYMIPFNIPIGNWNILHITNMVGIVNQPIGTWDVSNVTNMAYMFYCTCSFNQSIGDWNVSKVTNMEGMFSGANDFNQPISNWNVSNVIHMDCMFDDCLISEENKPTFQ